tara:strand:- start:6792 stop:7199 length:408 start_codon:yes stop_codon:yes gene_type:complete
MTGTRSGTPLVRTLDLRDGQRVWFDAMPESVIDEIDEYALELVFVSDPAEGLDAAHIFVTEMADLAAKLATLRQQIAADGQVWVSWPEPSSGTPTNIDADKVRAAAQPLGFVDTKEAAVDPDSNSLKLVIRKELR